MKSRILWTISICAFLVIFTSCADRIYRSAENKTNSEISKKVNQKIGDVFKGKKEKEPTASEPKGQPKDDTKTVGINNENEPSDSIPPNDLKLTRNITDFVAGTKIIFLDSLHNEQLGEFPSKWDLARGSVENMQTNEINVIGFTAGQSTIFPLMEEENYLPEKFTIEFDCYFHNYGNEGYYLYFNGNKINVRINIDGVKMDEQIRTKVENRVGWRHVELSFNKRALKLYYEGERLLNIPRLKEKPLNVQFGALSHGRTKGKYAMIKNIRIAEGAVPLYDRLTTDGKLVFNNIHFDYNKATLKSESLPVITEIAKMMSEHPDLRFIIEGHTDSDGAETFNQILSEQRAIAVKTALSNKGIASTRLQTSGKGEMNPIDSNTTAEGKAQNRRVEFIML